MELSRPSQGGGEMDAEETVEDVGCGPKMRGNPHNIRPISGDLPSG